MQLNDECVGDHYLGMMDEKAKVMKQVRALSNDVIGPRYRLVHNGERQT